MEKIKVIHCGDMHFDTAFYGLTRDKSEQRKEDLRENFGRIIDIAKQEKVDLILISGDLFDNLSTMKTTIDFIIKKLQEIPHIKVFIAPGNHDPYFNKSYYTMLKWPENVHIFKDEINHVLLPELNTCVYGIGFGNQHEPESLIEGFSIDRPELINIMVLHGDVVSSSQLTEYNPITIKQIENSGLDYLALGHKHAFTKINKNANTSWAYCGTPEGKGFDELGPKGIIIGEIGKDYINLKFREISKRIYYEIDVDIRGCLTYEDIKQIITKMTALDKQRQNNLYKIILIGEIEQGFNISTLIVEEKIKDEFYFVKVIDNTELKINFEVLAKEYSLLGIFTNNMRSLLENCSDDNEKKLYEDALKMGLQVLKNEEVK
ncbi:DNA repair exonuclease SbcCD nuclease subunit [Desulfonispora thiosulfatigenes DSM 11270]|uniref:DNA repair exonuclease SbcCD nuclease subunit n=1 Tax=Desulfonispora thiosulfatigenes DSM 11270 TaxID=656914 RepID=A0A1W1VAD8_DESTI|nr:DNA repair exonuclease [Desulfonispora thiosulfatigenes]SMB90285.1 DNA repair exonuclease SbcCD nuclease subunit [Desulfonispora thiosulfatigenes DSM 11270]